MASFLDVRVWMIVIGSFGIALGFYGPMFQQCARYCSKDPPEVSGAINVCVKGWDNCTYCKFYTNNCPDIQECQNKAVPIPSHGDRCMICPGVACVYNGHAYFAHEMFDSVDGVNKCMCLRGGKVRCDKFHLGLPMSFCS
ncbi:uncharacterized protein LOC117317862 [Pecten maximus]|uniref:uncharacterized protein LOC117317862 n=1 Tax=Pecten maximus TaxID=6579 RepID=UPI001458FB36|nr:uncharacterized protein LOC117317862 [Pecten maximus]XP_033728713.1 uncharacterized protein LOC117317862 [Pecten maximus]